MINHWLNKKKEDVWYLTYAPNGSAYRDYTLGDFSFEMPIKPHVQIYRLLLKDGKEVDRIYLGLLEELSS